LPSIAHDLAANETEHIGGRIDPVRFRSSPLNRVAAFGLCIAVIALPAFSQAFAAAPSTDVPAWLKSHVGDGDGQIAGVVLQRARALYLKKKNAGVVKNPCYFAMDATRPNDGADGKSQRRFYIICEANKTFRAISAGHGGGRDLKGVVDFKNARTCAKNFGNALDSKLTAGGAYVTAETSASYEGYYRMTAGKNAVLMRSFVQFNGEGETANARARDIGGHAAVLLRHVCRLKDAKSPHADRDGYVRFGRLVDYSGGRSDGCTSWRRADAKRIVAMVKDEPTTLYIYPDAADIAAVAQAVKAKTPLAQAGLYWNATCLKEIHAPKYWPRKTLEPILAQYKKDHPEAPEQSPPLCKKQ
jgi:hypothetical protein